MRIRDLSAKQGLFFFKQILFEVFQHFLRMCRLFTVTSISHKKKGRKKERKKEKTETKKEKSTQHEKKEKKRPTSATQPPFISNQVLKTHMCTMHVLNKLYTMRLSQLI